MHQTGNHLQKHKHSWEKKTQSVPRSKGQRFEIILYTHLVCEPTTCMYPKKKGKPDKNPYMYILNTFVSQFIAYIEATLVGCLLLYSYTCIEG